MPLSKPLEKPLLRAVFSFPVLCSRTLVSLASQNYLPHLVTLFSSWVPFPCTAVQRFLQAIGWSNRGTPIIQLPLIRDHCPLLPPVCRKSWSRYFFQCFSCFKVGGYIQSIIAFWVKGRMHMAFCQLSFLVHSSHPSAFFEKCVLESVYHIIFLSLVSFFPSFYFKSLTQVQWFSGEKIAHVLALKLLFSSATEEMLEVLVPVDLRYITQQLISSNILHIHVFISSH